MNKIEYASHMAETIYKGMRADGASRWFAFKTALLYGIKTMDH